MIIEQFYEKPHRTGYGLRFEFKYGFFMEYIYEEYRYDFKIPFIIIIEWLYENFGKFDKERYDVDVDWETGVIAICFKNEEDAIVFKMKPPFEQVRWVSKEEVSKELEF